MPKVSIVIPAYNAMAYLPATVATVLQQTFSDFEVLIINDGSTDQITSWAAGLTDRRLRLITQVNQGLSAARNAGITQAQGDYIAFLDADDLWVPSKLAKQVACFERDPAIGLVYTAVLFVDCQGQSTGRVMASDLTGNVWSELVKRNAIDCPSSVMVRRECFDRVGLFDRTLRSIEDWDMWLRIAAEYPLAVIPEPLTHYRQVPNSMSKNYQVMEASFKAVIEKTFQTASPDQLPLQRQSYANAYLVLAWKAIQSQSQDVELAVRYRQQAMDYAPQRRFSPECVRLSLAIAALQGLGRDNYQHLLARVHSIRRRLS
jgi:glycosyltransferase involved in cell wall biosynthesis